MLKESAYVKIRTAVPVSHANQVRQAMGSAGAGRQGNYRDCSGSYQSVGRFTPETGAAPSIGAVGKPEEVEEETIEMLCHREYVPAIIAALRKSHPYEEPAIDILPRLELE